jgi:hypothetical protein
MRSIKPLSGSFSLFNIKHFNRWLVFFVVLLLSLNIVSIAYADATFVSIAGPQWQSGNYVFTVDATLTTPQKYVCVAYTYGAGAQQCDDCTAGPTIWSCSIPEMANSTIAWNISAYPNTKCSGSAVLGSQGTFTTGPTAVKLTSFTTASPKGSILSSGSILLISTLGALILVTVAWKLKRDNNAG